MALAVTQFPLLFFSNDHLFLIKWLLHPNIQHVFAYSSLFFHFILTSFLASQIGFDIIKRYLVT